MSSAMSSLPKNAVILTRVVWKTKTAGDTDGFYLPCYRYGRNQCAARHRRDLPPNHGKLHINKPPTNLFVFIPASITHSVKPDPTQGVCNRVIASNLSVTHHTGLDSPSPRWRGGGG